MLLGLGLLAVLLPCAPLIAQEDPDALRAEYARRYRAVDQKAPDALAKLAEWCVANKLKTYANRLWRKVLRLAPQHDGANAAVGNEKVGGVWYPPDEARRARGRLEDERRRGEKADAQSSAAAAASLVEPPGEESSRAGVAAVLDANKVAATKLRDAFSDGIVAPRTRYAGGISAHVSLVARASDAQVRQLCQIGEYVYRRLSWVTFGRKDAESFAQVGGKHAFFLTEDPALEKALAWLGKARPSISTYNDLPGDVAFMRKHKLQFTTYHWPPVHVHIKKTNYPSAVANVMARTFLQFHAKPWYAEPRVGWGKDHDHTFMMWMLEGVGIWAALEAVGANRIYRIEPAKYAQEERVAKDTDLDYAGLALELVTTGSIDEKQGRSLHQLCRARMSSWGIGDLAMSFSLVDWLIRERTEDWRGLVEKLGKADSFRGAFVAQFGDERERASAEHALRQSKDEGALEVVFRGVCARVDAQWRAWVPDAYEKIADDPKHYEREAPFPPIRDKDAKKDAKKDGEKDGEKKRRGRGR